PSPPTVPPDSSRAFDYARHLPDPPSFPTRRSSDLLCNPVVIIIISNIISLIFDLTNGVTHRYFHEVGIRKHRKIIALITKNHHRSEEHTSELQSRFDLVCRLLLEKKKHISKLSEYP